MDPDWLLLLSLLLSFSQTETKVVQSVSDCDQFFIDGTPPQIPGVLEGGRILDQNRYKPICQTYDGHKTFFTLYDTTHKIPVFSAYKFMGEGSKIRRPKHEWMTEPELENTDNMVIPDTYNNQATDNDYKNQLSYDRGHLYPSFYGFNQTYCNSTFTLTNVVPQAKTFNQGSWNKMEKCVKCEMEKNCIKNNNIEGFLVTGAVPGNKHLKNRVNIPSQMWSAFCCYSQRENRWLASAHWGDNVPDSTKEQIMETKTLNQLFLEFSIDGAFDLFPHSECPIDTETRVNQQRNAVSRNCECPQTLTTTNPPTTTTNVTSTTPTTTVPTTTTTTTKQQEEDHSEQDGSRNDSGRLVKVGVAIGGAIGGFFGALFGVIGAIMCGLGGALAGVVGALFGVLFGALGGMGGALAGGEDGGNISPSVPSTTVKSETPFIFSRPTPITGATEKTKPTIIPTMSIMPSPTELFPPTVYTMDGSVSPDRQTSTATKQKEEDHSEQDGGNGGGRGGVGVAIWAVIGGFLGALLGAIGGILCLWRKRKRDRV